MALTKGTPEYEAFLQQWREEQETAQEMPKPQKPAPAPTTAEDDEWRTVTMTFPALRAGHVPAPFRNSATNRAAILKNNSFFEEFETGCRDLLEKLENGGCPVQSLIFSKLDVQVDGGIPTPRMEGKLRFVGFDDSFDIWCDAEPKNKLTLFVPTSLSSLRKIRVRGVVAESFFVSCMDFKIRDPRLPAIWSSPEDISFPDFLQAIHEQARIIPAPEALTDFEGFSFKRKMKGKSGTEAAPGQNAPARPAEAWDPQAAKKKIPGMTPLR